VTRTVWPYIRPRTGIEVGPWQLCTPDSAEPLPRELPHWDYNTDLHLTRSVEIDIDAISAQCGLADDARLGVAAVSRSSGSGLRVLSDRRIVIREGQDPVRLQLDFALKGTDVGGVLTVSTHLFLDEPGSTDDPTAPRRPGSVLWSDESSVRLQGDAARFPMDLVDFRDEVFPDRGGWHLKIGRDLEAAAMGSILLLINSANKTLAQAVARASSPRVVDRVALSALFADVTRAMIEHALAQPEFDDDTDYPDESLGEVLRNLCRRIFPGEPINELRLRHANSPTLLATDIQSGVGIFEETA
jgi:hypothetical protein